MPGLSPRLYDSTKSQRLSLSFAVISNNGSCPPQQVSDYSSEMWLCRLPASIDIADAGNSNFVTSGQSISNPGYGEHLGVIA
jgi:hypothetical protein